MRFLYYYLRSMRLYYAFVTGTTVLAGMLAARCIRPVPWSLRDGVILTIGFLAWGVNQIFNDFGNRREDALNAPHRPMVDGRLAPLPALGLSSLLTVFFVFAAYRVEPVTLIPLGIGIVLNLLYNAGKRVPLLGCAVYGLSISMCLFFGFSAVAGGMPDGANGKRLLLMGGLCALIHAMMCHFSSFKDLEGDRAAGVRTLQVTLGWRTSFLAGAAVEGGFFVFFASGIFLFFITCGALGALHYFCGFVMTAGIAAWHLACLRKHALHAATCANCQSCVAQILLLSAFFLSGRFPVIPAIPLCFLLIQLLFLWYDDEKE